MGTKKDEISRKKFWGWVFMIFFAALVLTGIIVKRVFHHPEFMMFFHLPAAVFLVLAGRNLPVKLWQRYSEDCEKAESI